MFAYKENLLESIIISFPFDSYTFLVCFENRLLFKQINTILRSNQINIDAFKMLSVKCITMIKANDILIDILTCQQKIYIILR